MTKNVSTTDRGVRIALGIILGIIVVFGYTTGIVAILLLIASIVLIVTGLMGSCPLYSLFAITTKKDSDLPPPPPPQNPNPMQ